MNGKLDENQKQQVLSEIEHYLATDNYDFGVTVGPFTLIAGELAETAEAAMAELSGENFDETAPDEQPSDQYIAEHAKEWMERHPHGWYESESDYGVEDEEEQD